MSWVVVRSVDGKYTARFFVYPDNLKPFIKLLKEIDKKFKLYEYDGEQFTLITEDEI